MAAAIDIDATGLILQSEVKGIGGKDAPRFLYDRLVGAFRPQSQELAVIEI